MIQRNSQAAEQNLEERLKDFHNLPMVHEADSEWDMGEANLHALAEHILRYGIAAHLGDQPRYCTFSNMNLYYQPRFPRICVAPDVMVVAPRVPQPDELRSYRIESDGPAPVFVAEVLSEETAEERDLEEKLYIYAMTGIEEYLLVDVEGQFLPQRLVLKRLQPDRSWKDEQDTDGGVTSQLGFRAMFETDGRLRVVDAVTGRKYARPDEAEARIRALEEELARLRGASTQEPKKKGRRGKS
ncbi:MAG TPA: Uma2 family endonuclease [Gemmataceae bacterium]|nr:Uma2 family endonuclease [Gemmataceae bacterium]